MAKAKTKKPKYVQFMYKKRRVRVLLDKVLIFRYARRLHGRFWGIGAVSFMIIGFSICFAIRPDLLTISTAFSEFGNDVRTAPYFAGSVFVGAYGLWRWRNYLARTFKNPRVIYSLVTLTIIGLYLTALMPISWKPWAYRIHLFGFSLAGLSMLATVVVDGLLSKTPRTKNISQWRLLRAMAIFLILAGGWLTIGSISGVALFDVALLGESMILAGYGLWVGFKTYLGEGRSTALSKIIKKFVFIS